MDFIIDENLPPRVAQALNALAGRHEHRVFHVQEKYAKGIKDVDLIKLIGKDKLILITNDLKMKTRSNEFTLLKDEGVSAFLISLPRVCDFDAISVTVINKWKEIREIAEKAKQPFVCRIKLKGDSEFL